VDIVAPSIYIAKRESFFVEKVTLKFAADKNIADLVCVLPSVYNNEDPINPFK